MRDLTDLLGPKPKIESRWPVVFVIGVVLVLLSTLPSRLRLFPSWVPYLLAISVVAPMLGVSISNGEIHWMRFERVSVWIFVSTVGSSMIDQLRRLLGSMMRNSTGVAGLQLLTSSIAMWVTNVLIFSIVYWRIDRGGPEARASQDKARRDWRFPQDDGPNGNPEGWNPTFVDYLFLGYCTATAFTPTDVQPMTPRAKLLMMIESIISLVLIIVVTSRAINILGS